MRKLLTLLNYTLFAIVETALPEAKNHYNNKCITSTDFETKKFKQNHAMQLRVAILLTPTPLRFDNNFGLIVL